MSFPAPDLSDPSPADSPLGTEERLRLAAEAAGVGTFDFDPVSGVLFWDERLRALFGLAPNAPLDYDVFLAATHPADRERAHAVVARALDPDSGADGEYVVEFRPAAPAADGGERWLLARGRAFFDADRTRAVRFAGTVTDVTDRRRAEDARRASEERYRTLVESIDVGFCVLQLLFDAEDRPVDYRFLEANPAFERHTGLIGATGRTARELVPGLDDFWFETYGRVALTGEPTRFENHAPAMGRWYDVYALRVGAAEERRVGIFFTDITARKDAEAERERLVAELGTRARQLRRLADASPVINSAASATEMLRTIRDKAQEIIGAREALVSITRGVDDGPTDRGVPAPSPTPDRLTAPLVGRDGKLLGRIELTEKAEGAFTEQDQAIVAQLAQLAAVAIENQRLYHEARERAEREAVLSRIGAAIRAALPPEEIQAVAVKALGAALGADRCYFLTFDFDRDRSVVGHDYHAADLPSLAGSHPLSAFGIDIAAVFGGGRTFAVADTQRVDEVTAAGFPWTDQTAATMASSGIRALVNVPFHDARGTLVAALGVAMSRAPRRWTPEEVAFIERVATETRSAMDAVGRQQRERNIAETLQAALQPPPPPDLPGLSLEGYYRPALAEAGVGGDFYDVFPVGTGRTALVVGDLSGKGLAAASEVATVRNMTRYALYAAGDGAGTGSLGAAITSLDRMLVQRGLLTGFATLFIGVYDHRSRTLAYVNCGQEPGLIRRAATGEVEELTATGAVLGGFAGGGFDEAAATLAPGDVIALFTDGLTDIGASRRRLLGLEGVKGLLREAAPPGGVGGARPTLERLLAGVDDFGRGATRDDIALLVGVVGDGGPDAGGRR